jgi:hypothetical protein
MSTMDGSFCREGAASILQTRSSTSMADITSVDVLDAYSALMLAAAAAGVNVATVKADVRASMANIRTPSQRIVVKCKERTAIKRGPRFKILLSARLFVQKRHRQTAIAR